MSNNHLNLIDLKIPLIAAGTSTAAAGSGSYVLKTAQWIDVWGPIVTFGMSVSGWAAPIIYLVWKAWNEREEWKHKRRRRK